MADMDKTKSKAQSQVKRKVKSRAKRKVKRIHPMTFFICFLALVLGIGAGVGAYALVSADDCFRLKGDEAYTFKVGANVTKYTDEGVRIISFGKDISSKVEVSTNLPEIDDGVYAIDTSEPGEYYMIYTVDDVKFGKIQRVRTISIKGE